MKNVDCDVVVDNIGLRLLLFILLSHFASSVSKTFIPPSPSLSSKPSHLIIPHPKPSQIPIMRQKLTACPLPSKSRSSDMRNLSTSLSCCVGRVWMMDEDIELRLSLDSSGYLFFAFGFFDIAFADMVVCL